MAQKFSNIDLKTGLLVLFLLIFIQCTSNAQSRFGSNDTLVRMAVVYEGDTIEAKVLAGVYIYSFAKNMSGQAKWTRLRNAVYVTYPYAKAAGKIMNEVNAKLVGVTDRHARKAIIKEREKELKKEFTDPLTNLSVYQGKVLMKLINRETGNNCYEIIKEYKGGFNARMYQTVAFFFNSNLKQSYDAISEDVVIEKFVKEVQRMYGYNDAPHLKSM